MPAGARARGNLGFPRRSALDTLFRDQSRKGLVAGPLRAVRQDRAQGAPLCYATPLCLRVVVFLGVSR
jgi:hypothetical protein